MPGLLAKGLLLLLLLTVGVGAPLAAPPEAASPAERSLELLRQVDLQALSPAERRQLLLGVADQVQAAGQPEAALDLLVRALDESEGRPPLELLDRLQAVLEQLDRPTLEKTVFLYAGSEAARRAQRLLDGPTAQPALAAETAVPAVGVLLPLSGRHAPFGQAVRQGLELAAAFRPPAAAARFLYRDTAAEGGAAELVAKLAGRPEVLAVAGPLLSAEAEAAAARAEAEGLPLLLLAPREGAAGGHVFRLAMTPVAQVRALVDFAVRRQGLGRFLILAPADRHGELFAALFQAEVERQGGQVLARHDYPPGAVDLRPQLQTLAATARRAGSPQALFIPDDARQVAQILPQLAFSRLDELQLIGTSAWNDPDLVRLAGPLSEGALFVDGFFADSYRTEVREFVARFQATHGTAPNLLHAQGYDAGRLLHSALARPEVHDRDTLRHAMATLRSFAGATGAGGFGPDGEAAQRLFLLQVQGGVVVQVD